MIIKGGTLVYSDKSMEADILIEDGKIKKIGKIEASGEKTVNANGLLVLPGLVDVHVHLREPGGSHKEDFLTGTKAALAGGVTTVLAMPNTSPSIESLPVLEEAKKLAKKSVCDYGFNFGASTANQADAFKASQDSTVAALKIYVGSSTGSLLVSQFEPLFKHFVSWPEGKPIIVHAEDDDAVKFFTQIIREEKKSDATAFDHNACRPPVCAEMAAKRALCIAEYAKKRVHVGHLSTAGEVAAVKEARKNGVNVSCEVTPHHLFLTIEDAKRLRNFGKMNPPLRSKEDVAAMWKALNDGVIDCVATDHAPHTRQEKEQHFWEAPSGLPGLETMLPLMLNAVADKRTSINKVVEVCSTNPAKIFGLKSKGSIAVGKDADLVLVDSKKKTKIDSSKLYTKCGWTPWDGETLSGKISKVFLRGEEVFDGSVTASEGSGRPVKVF